MVIGAALHGVVFEINPMRVSWQLGIEAPWRIREHN